MSGNVKIQRLLVTCKMPYSKSNVRNILNGKHFCSLTLNGFIKCAHMNATFEDNFSAAAAENLFSIGGLL